MRLSHTVLMLSLLLTASPVSASDERLDAGRTAPIDFLMERAISSNLIAGGVVVVGNHDGILYATGRGRLNAHPDAPMLDERTMFDVASLTKVIATTPAVMKLLDEGRISLQDPLSRWFPEFKGPGRGEITILHLLTHTSGLADFELRHWQSMRTAIHKAAVQKNRLRPGSRFNYADINFILLGELVHRVSGRTLDTYCREEIFVPLGARETMFLPPSDLTDSIAPTLGLNGGTVQDANARRLGSVAGHAGLFSSARDLALFARLMLGGGAIDGKRILSEQTVRQMTAPYICNNGGVVRCLGWDMESPYSAPKGSFFSEASFGHTGYSGSSIWIDPKQDQFVVMLTTRINYRDTRLFNQLRRNVSTIAAAAFRAPDDTGLLPPLDVAQISADMLLRMTQQVEVPRPVMKLAAARLGKRSTAHHAGRKKISKKLRGRRYGHIRRA